MRKDGSAAEKVDLQLAVLGRLGRELVHALDDAFFDTFWHGGVGVVLSLPDHQVIDCRFAFFVQLFQAVEDDDGGLVRKGRVVGANRGEGDRVEQAVAVLMLQAFAVERGATGGAAEQEAFGPHVGRGPDQIADPLEAEHRVVDEERNHVDAVRAIGRAGGIEATTSSRLR